MQHFGRALRAGDGTADEVAAVVADEALARSVVRAGDGTAPAAEILTARAAEERRREAPAIEEQDDLLVAPEGGLEDLLRSLRDEDASVVSLAGDLAAQIHHLDAARLRPSGRDGSVNRGSRASRAGRSSSIEGVAVPKTSTRFSSRARARPTSRAS
jgi:hypothetical protein